MERLQQIQEFLAESPQDPFLNYALTMEYVKLGRDEEALQCFEKMVSEFPDYVGTYYHFGKFLEKNNHRNRAEEVYNTGIAVARTNRKMHALSE
ncbi:MAG TPA: tetratricopeptide repeat protein, partial [Sphingobacterium sp.]|nr:tetratricopeptide repeat protein [Sphingobacterium sp.]